MTKHERNIGIASLLCTLVAVTLVVIVFSTIGIGNALNTAKSKGEAQYADQLQCVADNKKILAALRRDSIIPAREQLLRVQYTKSKIARCREKLPNYLRYRDMEATTANNVNQAESH